MNAWTFLEFQRALRRRGTGAALALGLAAIGLTRLAIPALPPTPTRLLEQSYLLHGPAEVVLLNTLLAVWFCAYFAGAVGLLDAIAGARADGSLALLIARPVSPARLVGNRALPAIAAAAAVGILLSVAQLLGVSPWLALPDRVDAGAVVLGGALTTALALAQLGLLALLSVRVADLAAGVGLAIAVFVAPLLPAAVFVYRPDLFTVAAREALLLPANLVWFGGSLGLPLLGAAIGASVAVAAGVGLAGRVLARGD